MKDTSIRKLFLTGVWIISIIAITGCQQKIIVNEAGFIQTITVDVGEKHPFKYGISFPQESSGNKTLIWHSILEAPDFQGAMNHFNLQTQSQLVVGQLRNILFGEEVARQPVNAIRHLVYDSKFPLTSNLLMVKGKASGIFQAPKGELNLALYQLLMKLHKNKNLTLSSLFNFIRDDLDDGIEPVCSIASFNKNDVRIHGMALFRNGSWVATLPEEDVNFMLTLRSNRMTALLYIPEERMNKQQPLIIENAQVKRKIRVIRTDPYPEVEITLSIKGATTSSLNELGNNNVGTSSNITKQLQRKYEQVIRFLQEQKTDCLGIGAHVRNKIGYPAYKGEEWPERFAKSNIRCIVTYSKINEV
ncbi:hypothetical protein M5X00_16885 [Paenibacillus alvei]|uniref:Germination protein, Ger(X)C family n=1 Tax=Paenibacillus alvei TaxID=44250 RepID=A0ABT4H5N6_PAEAL|nr:MULTISPECIES: Ger(x)C family spore germination C-terminal domain-containing protein [Paenibacillus]EJW17639.1 germination protein, Ger(X)C family [Paenibacillus alvei DSM 29]MCY7486816.1 hypothetical protein [Paenibacillus alvei]MCY9540610.1 hypothetical protein [Paenibacillus alvei]MCY9707011.1 hypothetical protein [Paenibacillus alvei]MCY9736019.1 hypothetical protein [Paenibacillus alvei]